AAVCEGGRRSQGGARRPGGGGERGRSTRRARRSISRSNEPARAGARARDQGQREMIRLNVGVIGLGRLGRVYARDLSGRIPETRLVAVADPVGTLAQEVAAECDVAKQFTDPGALIDDPSVDA